MRSAIRRVVSSRLGFVAMSNPDDFDNWPANYNRVADAAHLHAIGQFSLMYNYLEEIFGFVFQCSVPADANYLEFLFHQLNNRERADMLSAIVQFGENDAAALDHQLYAIRCFDICTDNRNIVLHAAPDITAETFRLSKRARNNPTKTKCGKRYANRSLIKSRIDAVELAAEMIELLGTPHARHLLLE